MKIQVLKAFDGALSTYVKEKMLNKDVYVQTCRRNVIYGCIQNVYKR